MAAEIGRYREDFAAGVLIVKEAGGVVSDFAGGEEGQPFETLATNGRIHEVMSLELMSVKRGQVG
ncbi:inositol monophosphatase [Anaerohalosphaera lusitana]|uniref:Inositol monophosphatase n=1 Tax=Anaerohalosphaera lusitana TaxID=1936003 RepID=A0A1U9NNX9_9BACT|nr:inositol monophosphatase family protein [Anaerohalosphaera lusitana]AQT69320.1 inositol monophosphatase [Anaerohalosphaera lusitana]